MIVAYLKEEVLAYRSYSFFLTQTRLYEIYVILLPYDIVYFRINVVFVQHSTTEFHVLVADTF